MNKNNNTNNSNSSINFNSISLNNNEIGNGLYKDNNNLLVSIVEHIENNNECQNELEDKEEFINSFSICLTNDSCIFLKLLCSSSFL